MGQALRCPFWCSPTPESGRKRKAGREGNVTIAGSEGETRGGKGQRQQADEPSSPADSDFSVNQDSP